MATTEKKRKGKITDLFFKVEEIPESAPAPIATEPHYIGLPQAQEDAKIKEQLAAALESANVEGFDYFEFAQALEAQTTLIPSEAQRFQTIYATAKVMGVTPDKLISSAQHYLDVLKKKEDEFKQALEGHRSEAVTAKEEGMKKIDTDMLALNDQIRKINENINAMQQQRTAMANEISKSQAEIAQVENNFNATLKVFTGRISSDIEKIKTYLKS
jgi:chromosome segregation ATPase